MNHIYPWMNAYSSMDESSKKFIVKDKYNIAVSQAFDYNFEGNIITKIYNH